MKIGIMSIVPYMVSNYLRANEPIFIHGYKKDLTMGSAYLCHKHSVLNDSVCANIEDALRSLELSKVIWESYTSKELKDYLLESKNYLWIPVSLIKLVDNPNKKFKQTLERWDN